MGCDLCAIYSATQARGEGGQGPFLGVAEQFTYFGTLQDEGREVPNQTGQYLNSSISQVFAGYNLTERFGLQFNLPVIYRSFKRPDGMGGIDRGTESGLGDVSLLGSFVGYRKLTEQSTLSWSIVGGVKFPTGSTDRLKEELHEVQNPVGQPSGIHGHDLTLGTGSFDGIVGTGIYARWKRVFLTGPGVYAVLSHKCTLAVQAVVSGEYKDRDTFRGEKADDTGVTAVYLGPQVSFTWSAKLSAEIGADFPLSIANTSLQAVPDYRVRGGLTWRF